MTRTLQLASLTGAASVPKAAADSHLIRKLNIRWDEGQLYQSFGRVIRGIVQAQDQRLAHFCFF